MGASMAQSRLKTIAKIEERMDDRQLTTTLENDRPAPKLVLPRPPRGSELLLEIKQGKVINIIRGCMYGLYIRLLSYSCIHTCHYVHILPHMHINTPHCRYLGPARRPPTPPRTPSSTRWTSPSGEA